MRLPPSTLLPPVPAPEKIWCIGVNYAERNDEYKDGSRAPKYPSLFCRAPGSFVGHEQPIERPRVSEQLDYEGEIALVIGKERPPHRRSERALEHIAGYTLCNEGTRARLAAARQVQRHAGQELRSLGQPRPVDRHHRRDRSRQSRCI